MPALALSSPRPAAIDALRSDRAAVASQVLGIVGFALLAALGAQFRIYLWEIPITFQTLAIYGSGLFLGARNGLLAMGLYLLAGMFFPVFASDAYGPAYLFGAASAGYLLAAPLAAAAIGALSTRWNTFAGSGLALLAGSALIFTVGVSWLYTIAGGDLTAWQAIERGWLRFALFDLAKIGIVALAYVGARRATARD
jgi:biotin transport system substrate-specific component